MEKRILTIQDFSCMGRCSLTVAIPTISACGVECVSLPTAVLSNHTAFDSWTYLDMTDQMLPSVEKWMKYRHSFDMIYTGYLSNDQIPTVIEVIHRLKEERTMIFVDPAMADRGKLYPGFDESHVRAMRELITHAEIVKPNLTEACLLTGIEYPGSENNVPLSFYESVAEKLFDLGVEKIIITGQSLHDGKVSDLCFSKEEAAPFVYETEMHPGLYHGTGDLFASCFAALLVKGFTFEKAVMIAHDYVHAAIGYTIQSNLDGITYGPEFESAIPELVKAIQEK